MYHCCAIDSMLLHHQYTPDLPGTRGRKKVKNNRQHLPSPWPVHLDPAALVFNLLAE